MDIKKLIFSNPESVGRKRSTKIPIETYIRKMNRLSNCYASVYNGCIKNMFFDIDENVWENTMKLHNYLLKNDSKHSVVFSGRGFHVYVMCKEYPTSKQTLWNGMNDIITKSGCVCDRHVVGDIKRIARITGTKNIKTGNYCIPLYQKDIDKGFGYVKELSKQPRTDGEIFGNKEFVLNEYDIPEQNFSIEIKECKCDVKSEWLEENLPPLITKFLKKENVGWRERFLTILAMKEIGLSLMSTMNYCKMFWNAPRKHGFSNKSDFTHAVNDEGNQFKYIYGRNDFFPNWGNLSNEYKLEAGDWAFQFYK